MTKKKTKIPYTSDVKASPQELIRSRENILTHEFFTALLDRFPKTVLVLDTNRQAIYCNRALLRAISAESYDDVLGKRAGDLFRCVHAEEGECGTTESCGQCGAVKAVCRALDGESAVEECRLLHRLGKENLVRPRDLRVWAEPIELNNERFVVFILDDISDEKRREVLEHTFFHDLMNEATIMQMGFSNLKRKDGPDPGSVEKLYRGLQNMVETVQAHRDLLAAERDQLVVEKSRIQVQQFLRDICDLMKGSGKTGPRRIVLEGTGPGQTVTSDRVILKRVIINLLKNAMEASKKDEAVKAGFKKEDGWNVFYVQNPAVMSEEVRQQIFQRSFSTKGRGRGIGTYSVKLFTERYLEGKVRFTSDEKRGTVFTVMIP